MNVLSLFDGMSCWQIALERAWIKVDKYFSSEIKKHAIEVTQLNYPNTIQLWDVRNIKAKDLPKIDLLIWWSPCQDLSQANHERKWLEWDKSSLFYEYVRLLEELKPTYFLLENVKMPVEAYEEISLQLWVYPVRINSSLLSGQMRDRFYWTNIWPNYEDLFWRTYCKIPQPEDKGIMLSDILETWYTEREKSRALLESDSRPLRTVEKMIHRYIDSGFTTLIFKDEDTYLRVKEWSKQWYVDVKKWESFDGKFMWSDTRRGRHMKDKSNCLTRNSTFYVFTGDDVRYFTQTELERLQTVPEGYTSILSRNKASCLLWDGRTVDVIAYIFSFLWEQ
jgi:DNA (cytosine-5)-methyltransferase 3A